MARAKRKRHFAGGKITDSHSTIIDAARAPVRAAEKSPLVSKISLRRITRCRGSERRIKCVPVNGGFRATIVGSRSVQDIMVYLHQATESNLRAVQAIMEEALAA